MAKTGAERQRAYVQRMRGTLALLSEVIEALRGEVAALRAENAALKAEQARARQAAPQPPPELQKSPTRPKRGEALARWRAENRDLQAESKPKPRRRPRVA